VKFAQVLGRPDWTQDARFRSNRDRLAHKDALLEQIRALMAANTRDAWIDALEAAGVPCAPLHTLPEAMALTHVQALGLVQHVPGEDFRLTGLPLSFDGERPAIAGPAPRLGADNARHLNAASSPANQVSH
jgi:formyl-CoA transferase